MGWGVTVRAFVCSTSMWCCDCAQVDAPGTVRGRLWPGSLLLPTPTHLALDCSERKTSATACCLQCTAYVPYCWVPPGILRGPVVLVTRRVLVDACALQCVPVPYHVCPRTYLYRRDTRDSCAASWRLRIAAAGCATGCCVLATRAAALASHARSTCELQLNWCKYRYINGRFCLRVRCCAMSTA